MIWDRGQEGVGDGDWGEDWERQFRHRYRRFCRLTHESARDPESQRRFEEGFSGVCCSEILPVPKRSRKTKGTKQKRRSDQPRLVVVEGEVQNELLPGELELLSAFREQLLAGIVDR